MSLLAIKSRTVADAAAQRRPAPVFNYNPAMGKGRPVCILHADGCGLRIWIAKSSASGYRYKFWLCAEYAGNILVNNVLMWESCGYVPVFDERHGRATGIAKVLAAAEPFLTTECGSALFKDVLVNCQVDVQPYPGPIRTPFRYIPVAERRAALAAANEAAD